MNFEEQIVINDTLRLRKPLKEEWGKAFVWYQDKEILLMSEGIRDKVYTDENIDKMYTFLNKQGHLYFIEVFENEWISIGDATFSIKNLPIVIGDRKFWGKNIGKKVIGKFIEIAKAQGIKELNIPQICHYNERSKKLFLGFGFTLDEENKEYSLYKLKL